jgi:nocturnin
MVYKFISALGTKNDNFVRCPASALQWRTRRFRMLEEIARHDADVICLQEVDHFEFLRKSLSALGYEGRFFPKPDSPCLYLQENTGPDGCAIFYKTDRFELTRSESRVIEVWNVESNQVK